jgi:2-haloacid dehalogenase
MKYTTVLFDLDHTLYDFDQSESAAFDHAIRGVGLDRPEQFTQQYLEINAALWKAVERGELSIDDVRVERFRQLVTAAELDVDPVRMADLFVDGLGAFGDLYPGAREVLDALNEHCSLALVTNGFSEVQRARLDRIDIHHYFDAVMISAELGCSKPAAAFFQRTFEALGHPDKRSTLMVGDSLSADIRGASAFGISTCWYNPHDNPAGDDDAITHVIRSLGELPGIVLSK